MALGRMEKILILAKTYPSPSAQYVETSCVAGISENGGMRRLFPVPFRMVEDGQQFKKWPLSNSEWVDEPDFWLGCGVKGGRSPA